MTIFNRFSWGAEMCKKFDECGLEVIIINNNSTYKPCIEWLKNCGYKVENMEQNSHAWAFFETDLYKKYPDRFFFLSDSDFDISTVPNDFPDHLMRGLEKTPPNIWKVGLSYEINDLPDNEFTRQVIAHEKNFWPPVNEYGFYNAWIDIGVTLHDRTKKDHFFSAWRSDRPYTCRHLPWYHTKENITNEHLYFMKANPSYYGWDRKWYEEMYLKRKPK